jgi:predicted permease
VTDALLSDLRYALRWLRRSPAVAGIAVASLAVGIGLNAALFSVVDALLLRPLPVRAPQELVDIYTSGGDGDTYATSSYPDYLDFRADNAVFSDIAGHSAMFGAMNLPDRSRLVLGEVVTGNYFEVLGVSPWLGRALQPADDRPGADRVVVVSFRFWRQELGGSPDAVGRTLRLRGQTYRVVGVLPARFNGMLPMLAPEIWIPAAYVEEVEPAGIQDSVPSPTGSNRLDRRGQRWLFLKGRLKPGVTVDRARANLEVVMAQLAAAHPATNKGRRIAMVPTKEVRVHPDADRALVPLGMGLMVAVGLVLLIACANVASMLLARASARRREISVRLAIGASRARLVRQLLTESLLLAAAGAAGGVLLAWWLTRLAASPDLPIPIPISVDLRVDARVLAFTIAVATLAGVLAGLAPALRSTRGNLVADLRGATAAAGGIVRRWTLRDSLVALQIGITTVLLVSAGLLVLSLARSRQAEVGLQTAGVALLSTDVDMLRYDAARAKQFFEEAQRVLAALPGVTGVAVAERTPFSINFNTSRFYVPGHHDPGAPLPSLQRTRVSAAYFETLGVPILQGRGFTSADTERSPGVIVINETMARRYWPGESALGRRVHLRGPDGPAFEIVGIAADHKVSTVSEAPQPYVHFARSQQPAPYGTFVVRTRGDATRLLGQMRQALLSLEPNLVFVDNQTLDDQLSATLLPVRVTAWLVAVVGGIALLLAAIGLYGVIAYSVARRTREIGIRLALGARTPSVLGLVMRQGLVLAGAGAVTGGVLAAVAARALSGLLYDVTPADPLAWGGALAIVLGTAAAANLVPARRAAAVEPSVALRVE